MISYFDSDLDEAWLEEVGLVVDVFGCNHIPGHWVYAEQLPNICRQWKKLYSVLTTLSESDLHIQYSGQTYGISLFGIMIAFYLGVLVLLL